MPSALTPTAPLPTPEQGAPAAPPLPPTPGRRLRVGAAAPPQNPTPHRRRGRLLLFGRGSQDPWSRLRSWRRFTGGAVTLLMLSVDCYRWMILFLKLLVKLSNFSADVDKKKKKKLTVIYLFIFICVHASL